MVKFLRIGRNARQTTRPWKPGASVRRPQNGASALTSMPIHKDVSAPGGGCRKATRRGVECYPRQRRMGREKQPGRIDFSVSEQLSWEQSSLIHSLAYNRY